MVALFTEVPSRGILRSPYRASCIVRANRVGIALIVPTRRILVNTTYSGADRYAGLWMLSGTLSAPVLFHMVLVTETTVAGLYVLDDWGVLLVAARGEAEDE
jgi:hypothetical protein